MLTQIIFFKDFVSTKSKDPLNPLKQYPHIIPWSSFVLVARIIHIIHPKLYRYIGEEKKPFSTHTVSN